MGDLVQCPSCGKPMVVPTPPVTPGLNDLCVKFPELCSAVNRLTQTVNKLVDAQNAHPKPSAEFIQSAWMDCPDCSPAFQRVLIDHPELFTPKEAEEAEYVVPWKRK